MKVVSLIAHELLDLTSSATFTSAVQLYGGKFRDEKARRRCRRICAIFSLGCANFVAITVLIANTVLIIITKKWFALVLSEDFQWLDLKIKHQSDYKIDDEAGGHNQR